jgi:alpha-glucosidase
LKGTRSPSPSAPGVLVAPVLGEGETSRAVSPPPGRWYNYWNDSATSGGRSITVAAPMDKIPFFVRAGAVIPSQQLMQYSSQATIDPLTLTVYCTEPGKTDSTLYYEDDGRSFAYTNGVYFRRKFRQSATASQLIFTASGSDGSYDPPGRSTLVRFVGFGGQPSSVTLNGRVLPGTRRGTVGGTGSWEYDAVRHVVLVRMPETRKQYDLVQNRGR